MSGKKIIIVSLALVIPVTALCLCVILAGAYLVRDSIVSLLVPETKRALQLNPRGADGRVSGVFNGSNGQPAYFSVTTDGTAAYWLDGASESEKLTITLSDAATANMAWNGVALDGIGPLTEAERTALAELRGNGLQDALAMVPLDIACQGDEMIDPQQVAALLFPLQMQFKYQIADRATAALALIAQSECNYTDQGEDRLTRPSEIYLTPANPIPVVFGYLPFDAEGAVENAVSFDASRTFACANLEQISYIPWESPHDELLTQGGAAPIRDVWGACEAKCRGACGSDCTLNNCKLTGELRCEVDENGNNTGLISMIHIYDCGIHPACLKHDACYDDCNHRFGCGSWAAFYCRHGGWLHLAAPSQIEAESYLGAFYCDMQTVREASVLDGNAWRKGFGPHTDRQIYEYTDERFQNEPDLRNCPLPEVEPEAEDIGENAITPPDVSDPLQETETAETETAEEEAEAAVIGDPQTEEPTADPGDSAITQPIDPCALPPPGGAIWERSETYCQMEYELEPYRAVTIYVYETKPDAQAVCQDIGRMGFRLIVTELNLGDCAFVTLTHHWEDEATYDNHTSWGVEFVFDRIVVNVYTSDLYPAHQTWIYDTAAKVEQAIVDLLD